MKFALFGNTYQAKKSAHVERLLSILSQHNAEVHICREFYEFLTDDLKISILTPVFSMEIILKPT